MTGLKGRVVSGLRWQATAKLCSQLISWGVTIFVIRLLTPADYGLMAMTMVLIGLSTLVAEMGLGAALVRSPEVTLAQQRSVFGLTILVNAGLYLLLLALAPVSVAVFDEPRLLALTAVMGLQLPLAALCVVPESMARRELRFKALSLIELVQQTGAALTTLACAWAGWGVWALVAGHVASTAFKALALLLSMGTVRPSFVLRGQGQLAAFGGSLTTNRVIWYFTSQADIFIAGRLLGQQALGLYAVAVQLATMPMQKLMTVSNQVAFSAYAKLQSDPAALQAALLQSLTLMSAISVGLLWGLVGTAPTLIPLVLGAQWSGATLILQIVALIIPVRIAAAMLSTALIATGKVNADLKNTLTASAILVPAFLAGAALDGVRGLALAWAVGYPLFAANLLLRAARELQLPAAAVLRSLAVPLGAGVAMLLAIAAWRGVQPAWPAAPSLALEILVGAAAYLACLAVFARPILLQAAEFAGLRTATGSPRS